MKSAIQPSSSSRFDLGRRPEAGTLAGRVLDASGRTLPGAAVEVVGTNLRTSADETGSFVISPGARRRAGRAGVVHRLRDEKLTVTVTARETIRQDFTLAAPGPYTDTVTVNADPILRGQARALNQQDALNVKSIISSDQIGRFPDPRRGGGRPAHPRSDLDRDQGEGRYISIRGTDRL